MLKRANIILLVGVLWVFCICGVGYLSLVRPGIGTRWQKEIAPPEPLARLELGEAGEVLGYSAQGTIYQFNYGAYQTLSTWEEVTKPSGIPAIGEDCVSGNTNRIVFPPPGKVKSQVGESCVYIESAYHLEVALLENGEVWSWEHEAYAYTELFIISFLFIVLIIGALIVILGAGLMIYKKVKQISP